LVRLDVLYNLPLFDLIFVVSSGRPYSETLAPPSACPAITDPFQRRHLPTWLRRDFFLTNRHYDTP
jgi:hypothetical protein